MRVRFLSDEEVKAGTGDGDTATSQSFRAGKVYELEEASGLYWLRRGLAEAVVDKPKAAKARNKRGLKK